VAAPTAEAQVQLTGIPADPEGSDPAANPFEDGRKRPPTGYLRKVPPQGAPGATAGMAE
jgi:hypothetical protein